MDNSLFQPVIDKYSASEEVIALSKGQHLWEYEQALLDHYVTQNSSVLVIGCGAGREAIPLAQQGYCVTAVDLSERLVQVARAAASKAQVNAEFHVMNACNLDFQSQTFDTVILWQAVLCCIPCADNRKKALMESYRVLKPEGKMLICVNSRYRTLAHRGYWMIVDLLRSLGITCTYNHVRLDRGDRLSKRASAARSRGRYIIHYFTRNEIIACVEETGARILSCHHDYELMSTPSRSRYHIILAAEKSG